jgi:hypothetical protein
MKGLRFVLNPIALAIIGISLFLATTELTVLESLSIGVFIYALFNLIRRLSVKFVFIDLIILIISILWLLGPVISYHVFNKYNKLALLWDTYMKVSSDQYFSFVLPGTILFILGLKFPIILNRRIHDGQFIYNAKNYLKNKGNISLVLLGIGFVITMINPFLPSLFQGIFSFFAQLTFIGVFYALFSEFKYKKTVVSIAFLLLIFQCIMTGMYGELVYWSLLIFVLVIIGYNISIFSKMGYLILGSFLILFIQSIKHEYRAKTWGSGNERGSDPGYFGELIIDKISNPSKIFETDALFGMATRANQGFLIAKTMNYVPRYEPFAHGETIIKSVFAAFVPRIIWPNKPESGGRDLIVRFLGAPKNLNYSYNLSPIGEAYVNFNKYGAIIFMFFYGLFFNWSFERILKVALKYPSLIIWLPIFLIGPIQSMEGDVLGAINTMIKAIVFCWAMYFSFRVFFKIKL